MRKYLCGALAAVLIFCTASICAAAEESANAKLARIEIDTYGTEQSGAILDRISRLEKNYSGQNMAGNLNARIEAIYNKLYSNGAAVGTLAKMNFLEWNVNHQVASGGIDTRLAVLENQITGKPGTGTINDRINQLVKATYGEENLPITPVQIPANTLIKVATIQKISSKTARAGDIIPVKVIADVFINENLVFASGLNGEGIIINVQRSKNIFSNGKIETDFNKIKSLDGQEITTFVGIDALDEMQKSGMNGGLNLLGQTSAGFLGGKNIELPEGIELYIQIKEPVTVYGLGKNAEVAPLTREEFELAAPPVEEGKTLEGYDGELIEITDEE